jgi:hypothetical protein
MKNNVLVILFKYSPMFEQGYYFQNALTNIFNDNLNKQYGYICSLNVNEWYTGEDFLYVIIYPTAPKDLVL